MVKDIFNNIKKMKNRPKGFLSEENISHNGEVFDYIVELHEYLWEIIRIVYPSASGDIRHYLDPTVKKINDNLSAYKSMVISKQKLGKRLTETIKKLRNLQERYNKLKEIIYKIDISLKESSEIMKGE